jgi:hypothetical protein
MPASRVTGAADCGYGLANAQVGTVMYLMDTEPGKARTMAGDLNGTIVAALEELKTTVGPQPRGGQSASASLRSSLAS